MVAMAYGQPAAIEDEGFSPRLEQVERPPALFGLNRSSNLGVLCKMKSEGRRKQVLAT